MNSFIYGTLPRQFQRATRLRWLSQEGESQWARTALLAESSVNYGRGLRMGTMLSTYRFLSSARPLPEEELPDHNHSFWNDSPSKSRSPKRASLAKLRRNLPRIEQPKSPYPNNAINLNNTARVTDVLSTMKSREPDVMDSNETFHAFVNAGVPPQPSLSALPTESPKSLHYTGDAVIPISSVLHIVKPHEDVPRGIWPVFRLMDENGEFRDPSCDGEENSQVAQAREYLEPSTSDGNETDDLVHLRSKLSSLYPYQVHEINSSGLLQSHAYPYVDTNSRNTLLRAHRQLIRLRTMDTILQNAQRQGRISFYMTCTGEEAIHMGAGSALDNQDPIFAQYREQGLLMWRGFTLEQFTNQCFSNDLDLGKGRQMPIHYGSRALNYHTVSSPLGTQLPQAVGAAYRLKLMKKPNVAICFFGDGCASTTDFHAALNFAATLSAPVIFFCRNNGYAISTPVSDQYAGDGIVSRATGYGMAAMRVDGNDIFAVHAAVREAKKYALQHNAPVLIEGMTYRLGHHSTSDDSTRYRSEDEVDAFAEKMDPLNRLQLFLKRHDLLNDEELVSMKEEERIAVLDAIKKAEKRPAPFMESMFEDVYKEMPVHLAKQMKELKEHMAKYPDKN